MLAQCGARVTSIERDPELADRARTRLADLGYDVEVLVGDGSVGYPAHAPYAGIVVGAGAPAVPAPAGGRSWPTARRLVIPVGRRRSQRLTVVQRQRPDRPTSRTADACVFVPLVGRHGHPG